MTGPPPGCSAAPSPGMFASCPATVITLQRWAWAKPGCIGGMLTVRSGQVRLVATTFEWAEDIDKARAEASRKRAETVLGQKGTDARELELAQARLKRALVRTHVADLA